MHGRRELAEEIRNVPADVCGASHFWGDSGWVQEGQAEGRLQNLQVEGSTSRFSFWGAAWERVLEAMIMLNTRECLLQDTRSGF